MNAVTGPAQVTVVSWPLPTHQLEDCIRVRAARLLTGSPVNNRRNTGRGLKHIVSLWFFLVRTRHGINASKC